MRSCLALTLAFVVLSVLLLKACQRSDAHPSDSALIEEFHQNEAEFYELREMVLQERRVTRIGDGFIWIDGINGVEGNDRAKYLLDGRLAHYQKLFDELQLESGVIQYEDGSVGFLRSSSGFVTSGSSKEFIWSPRMTAPVLADSDKRTLEDACVLKTGCNSIRQIAPEWFIAFESD